MNEFSTNVNITEQVNFIWKIANKLRGPYKPEKYKDVIIPMCIIRRFECVLQDTKEAVLEQAKKIDIEAVLNSKSGYKFHNKSEFNLNKCQVLLVADKYQTGFDQPLLHTMYIDKKLRGVKAVQTLSRLNRTCPGKDDTFILDFKNDLEDIKKSFSTFYECTELVETLDPNLVYDLERKIENFNIINKDEVDKFIKKAYKENKTSKDRQQQISYISKALERVNRYNNDDILEIKAVLRKFTNFYSLMIQIADFEDVELHKLYIFSKFLVKAIEVESEDEVDISDKISLENFRQVRVAEEKEVTIESDGEIKHNSSITVGKVQEEFDALSQINNTLYLL